MAGTVLALDLAAKMTGYAIAPVDAEPARLPLEGVHSAKPLSGRKGFAGGAAGDPDLQIFLFSRWLIKMIDEHEVQVLVWEAPILAARAANLHTARLQIGLTAICIEQAQARRVPHWYEFPLATIKKHAGHGRMKKPEMLAAARAIWGADVADHNQADALFILDLGLCKIRWWRSKGEWTLEDAA